MTTTSYYILAAVLAVAIAIGFAMKEGNAPLEPKKQRGTVGYVFDGDTVRLRGGRKAVYVFGVWMLQKKARQASTRLKSRLSV